MTGNEAYQYLCEATDSVDKALREVRRNRIKHDIKTTALDSLGTAAASAAGVAGVDSIYYRHKYKKMKEDGATEEQLEDFKNKAKAKTKRDALQAAYWGGVVGGYSRHYYNKGKHEGDQKGWARGYLDATRDYGIAEKENRA